MTAPSLIAEIEPGIAMLDTGRHHDQEAEGLHSHTFGQLQVIERGLLAADIGSGRWIIPPGRVGWLPPGWPHAGRSYGELRVTLLYLDGDHAAALPTVPTVQAVTPLVAQLFQRLLELGRAAGERRRRLLDVLCDELAAGHTEPLHIPMPREPRLVRMCRALLENPADPRTLDAWASEIGLSRRTLSRHMVSETGLSFGRWRTQVRLHEAIRLLAEDRSVTDIAFALGFESVSSFTAGFRQHFGVPPTRYMADGGVL